jgi:hypothetical protein
VRERAERESARQVHSLLTFSLYASEIDLVILIPLASPSQSTKGVSRFERAEVRGSQETVVFLHLRRSSFPSRGVATPENITLD